MPRFRVIRGELDRQTGPARPAPMSDPEGSDPILSRRLRAIYAAPGEGYWDGFEATVLAAVRAGRAAPAAAAEWWHTLARWARPGLAAAAVVIGVVGGVAIQTEGSRSDAAARALIEVEPASPLEPLDAELARVMDPWTGDTAADRSTAEHRAAADLLSGGVKRREHVPLDLDSARGPSRAPRRPAAAPAP